MTLRSTRRMLSLSFESLERRRVLSADALGHDDGPEDIRHELECEAEVHRGRDDDSPDDTFDDRGSDDGSVQDPRPNSTELEARLGDESLAQGRAKFEVELEHGLEKRELKVDVRDAPPGSVLDVVIDGTVVGQVQVDAQGEGRLELSSQPGEDESPLPDNFPGIQSGSTITVGDSLTGTFASDDDGVDVSDDDSVDVSDDDGIDDDSGDDHSTDDVSDDSLDDAADDSHGDATDDSSDDASDIDHIFAAVREGRQEDRLDLNDDHQVDDNDTRFLVEAVLQSSAGDANLDGIFDSSDLILAFQQGQYEDHLPGNSGWSSGDWNGDGEFDSSDLVAAFQSGRYR